MSVRPMCTYPNCSYPAFQGWSLCGAHAETMERNLGDLGALFEQLDLTLSRQSALGERVGARGPEKPLGYHLGASAVLGAAKAVLVGWVRDLNETGLAENGHGHWPEDTHTACARYLLARIGLLRVHPAAAEIATEIADIHHRAVAMIDRAPIRYFAGFCDAELDIELGETA